VKKRLIDPKHRWIVASWAIQIVSLFWLVGYTDVTFKALPGFLFGFASIFLTQEALLKALNRQAAEDSRDEHDGML